MSTDTPAPRTLAEARSELKQREMDKLRARKFFWGWFAGSVVIMVLGNGLVPWIDAADPRIVRTVTVVIPPILAVLAVSAHMILSRVGVASRYAVWGTLALWGCSLVLTFEGMLHAWGYGVNGDVSPPASWTALLFPVCVDIPVAVALASLSALKPLSDAQLNRAARDLVVVAPRAETPNPAKRIVDNVDSSPVRGQTDKLADNSTVRADNLSVDNSISVRGQTDNSTVREQLVSSTDILERAQRLVDDGRTSLSVTDTARVLSALDSGQGASAVATALDIPRGRVMRIRDAERDLVSV